MNVLAIRGQNMGSLPSFDVDLSAPPLAATGLFAVTGETGAGKSTILDALSLALYGTYPRVTGAGNARVPDPSGEPLTIGDPRAILSRGAGEGFAEVDFIGVDGVGYRVRWGVARARGRANGRLRPATHLLTSLSDGSAVAAGLSQVAEAVPLRTGLTYTQFVRSAMLPQNGFDVFLTAPETERGAVLERITDTGIYAVLSARVHRGADERRRRVDELRTEMGAIGALPSEEREALVADLGRLCDGVAAASAERAALARGIEHGLRVVRAEELVSQAGDAVEAARRACDASGDARSRLARHDAVEPLRTLEAELRRAEDESRRATDAFASAERDGERLDAHSRLARDALGKATADLLVAEQIVVGFGPAWAEAEALDARIIEATLHADAAEVAEARLGEALTRARGKADLGRQALAGLTGKRHEIGVSLESTHAHDVLADEAGRIAETFDAYATALGRRDVEAARLPTLREQVEGWHHQAADAVEVKRTLLKERAAIDGLAASLRVRRQALGLPGLLVRREQLDRLASFLTEAHQNHRRHARAMSSRNAANRDAQDAREEFASQEGVAAVAEDERRSAEAERRGIAQAAERAEEAASHAAARLRAALVPGEPCPVCGAVEHKPASGSDLDTLAGEFRRRRDELSAEVERASTARTAALEARAAAAGRITVSESRSREAGSDLAETEDAFAARVPAIVELAGHVGVDVVIPTLAGQDDREAWLAISGTMGEARKEVASRVEEAEALGGGIEAAESRRRQIEVSLEASARSEAEAVSKGHVLQVELGAAEAALGMAENLVAARRAALLPILATGRIAEAEFDAESAAAGRLIAGMADARRQLRDEAASLDGAIAVAGEGLRGADEAADEAGRAHAENLVARDDRRRALAGLDVLRGDLLGGEPVSVHRARLEGEARKANERAGEARTAGALATAASDAATERVLSAGSEVARAAGVVEPASRALSDACASLGLTRELAADLLATPRVEVEEWRTQVRHLDREVEGAVALLDVRRRDLERARVEAAGMEMPEDAGARLLVLDAQVSEWTRDQGAREQRLHRDDKNLGRVADLQAAIDAATAEHAAWAEVDAAIGSSNGDAFRRVAQEITLDALVGLANEQLGMLAPRYRLTRGDALSLHVADLDMGGEVRASRSLSGGERFLVSLGLALALSGLEGRQGACDVLLIDEGFGSLDGSSLDIAIAALETLHGLGRRVGVVTHVAAMVERIPIQVRVTKRGGGRSVVHVLQG